MFKTGTIGITSFLVAIYRYSWYQYNKNIVQEVSLALLKICSSKYHIHSPNDYISNFYTIVCDWLYKIWVFYWLEGGKQIRLLKKYFFSNSFLFSFYLKWNWFFLKKKYEKSIYYKEWILRYLSLCVKTVCIEQHSLMTSRNKGRGVMALFWHYIWSPN